MGLWSDWSTVASNVTKKNYATNMEHVLKVLDTLLPNASVRYATSAGTSMNATYASRAGDADTATYATTAGNATYATNAGNATTATYASSSGTSANATYATNASSANSANVAAIAETVRPSNFVFFSDNFEIINTDNTTYYLPFDSKGKLHFYFMYVINDPYDNYDYILVRTPLTTGITYIGAYLRIDTLNVRLNDTNSLKAGTFRLGNNQNITLFHGHADGVMCFYLLFVYSGT